MNQSDSIWEDFLLSAKSQISAYSTDGQERGSNTVTGRNYRSMTTLDDRGTTTFDIYDNTTTLDDTSDPFWDQLPFAHEYWHQFDIEGIPAEYHYAVAIWMTFFGIIGVVGNLLVIYTFIR